MNALSYWDKLNDFVGTTIFHPQYFVIKAEKDAVNITLKELYGKVLDVGCGRQLLKESIQKLGCEYVSLDHPNISKRQRAEIKPDILADITDMPIKNNSFNSILLFMVLAHTPQPQKAMDEIFRVAKKGGHVFVSSIENYPAHDLPDDYFRYRISGIKALCTSAGFKIKKTFSWGNVWQVNAINFNMYLL